MVDDRICETSTNACIVTYLGLHVGNTSSQADAWAVVSLHLFSSGDVINLRKWFPIYVDKHAISLDLPVAYFRREAKKDHAPKRTIAATYIPRWVVMYLLVPIPFKEGEWIPKPVAQIF